jgi:hypothetical protein
MYRRKAGVRCGFEDVVLSGFMVKMGQTKWQEEVRERMKQVGYDITQRSDVLKYIGQKRIWGGLEASELLREYYLLHRE